MSILLVYLILSFFIFLLSFWLNYFFLKKKWTEKYSFKLFLFSIITDSLLWIFLLYKLDIILFMPLAYFNIYIISYFKLNTIIITYCIFIVILLLKFYSIWINRNENFYKKIALVTTLLIFSISLLLSWRWLSFLNKEINDWKNHIFIP